MLAAVLLAGCQAMQVSPDSGPDSEAPPPEVPAEITGEAVTGGGTAELTRYATSVRALSAAALEQEYRALIDEAQSSPSIETDIKLSLLLSTPAAPFRNVDQATRLLGDVMLRLQRESETAEFARLIYYLLSERACVASGERTLAELLLDERERAARLDLEVGELRAALASERSHRQTLQRQLDALRALEEQITSDSADSRADGEPAATE